MIPEGLHIYIPTCSIGFIKGSLDLVSKSMSPNATYELVQVLDFIGKACWCGENRWRDMGWLVGRLKLPQDDLCINRMLIQDAVKQMRRERRN